MARRHRARGQAPDRSDPRRRRVRRVRHGPSPAFTRPRRRHATAEGRGSDVQGVGARGGAPAKPRARHPRRAGGWPPAVPSRAAVAGVPRGLRRAARQRHVRASVGVRPGGEARRRRDCPRGDSGRGRRRLPEGVGAVGGSQPVRRERRREGRDRADAAAGGGGLAAARGDGTERGG